MTTDIDTVVDEPSEGGGSHIEPTEAPTSRRSFVSKGAIAAAIGAAAGIALSEKASAANGNDLNLGDVDNPDVISDNTATNTTRIIGGSTFEVWGGSSNADASIYGHTAGTGGGKYGVRGQYDGTQADGAGVYGYNSDTSGSPGVGVRGESAEGTGVHGKTEGTTGGTGVLGESVGTEAYGVRGRALGTRSVGVYGVADTNASIGVSGQADVSNGIGVKGNGGRYDFSAAGSGIVNLTAIGTDVGPSSTGAVGSIARNSDGSLWYCHEANTWQKVAPVAGGGPSVLNYTPVTPFRVYDSRQETDGAFAGGENRTISVADSRDVDTYAVVTADAVPAGAVAVTGNVVAIQTTDTGFLSINPGGTTAITAATVNWAAGMNIGNAGTFALNGSRELEAVFGPGNGAHMTIDITGFYT